MNPGTFARSQGGCCCSEKPVLAKGFTHTRSSERIKKLPSRVPLKYVILKWCKVVFKNMSDEYVWWTLSKPYGMLVMNVLRR